MHEQKDHNLFENMTTKCIYLCGDAAYNKSNFLRGISGR
jgi:hypothetical protein